MKKMTCKAMGGACDTEITGETADELMANGKAHVHDTDDDAHKAIMEKMAALSPEEHEAWQTDFRAKFDTLDDA